MFKFLVRFFALIGFVVVALIAVGIYGQYTVEPEPRSIVLTLDFTTPIAEQNDVSPLALAMEDEPEALLSLLQAIETAKDDPRVKGIAARFGVEQPSFAHAQEIRAALARFRETGKFTYAFGSDFGEFGSGSRAYYLASAFENIWLQPVGTVSLTGISLQSPFAKSALDKIGITADFMQREEYKSFMEVAQRDSFSPPVKAEMQLMLDNLSHQLAAGIALGRKWDIDHVKDLMARGPYTDEEAVQEGLVTKLAYADEFDSEIERKAGADAKSVDVPTYLGYAIAKKPTVATVALIFANGVITDKAVGGGGIIDERIVGADAVAAAFSDAVDDENVKAILFRIDSPGGSPAASETIRRAMIRAQNQGKPVIVSMGETAASGGYWIAMNGDKIVADPSTITGSIGVLAGKFTAGGLLEKLGVSVDGVTSHANAGMWNMAKEFSPEQRARVNALLDNTYSTFVSNVSMARNIPIDKMPEIAKGRVWTGEQALKLGLVDALGGYEEAINQLRTVLKVGEKEVIGLQVFPAPPTPAERLLKLMRRFGAEGAAMASMASMIADVKTALSPFVAGISGAPVSLRMAPLGGVHE